MFLMVGRPRKPKTELAKRLILARESAGRSTEDTAEACGVSAGALANYERGDNIPDAEFLRKFVKFTGTEAWELLSGESARSAAIISADMVQIPRFDVRAAAGAGTLAVTEGVSSYVSVERDWLRRMMPGWAPPNAQVGIVEVNGDSMYPTLLDGDLVIAISDPPERVVDNGGIFFVRHHGHLRVKRLHVDMRSGDISLLSDNPHYPPEVVRREHLEHELQILAAVFIRVGKLKQ